VGYRNSANAGRLVHDNSMIMLGSMLNGGSDANAASHKLFLTAGKDQSRTGSRNNGESMAELKVNSEVKPRKIFGANDYLNRQASLKGKQSDTTAVDFSSDFAEMQTKMG